VPGNVRADISTTVTPHERMSTIPQTGSFWKTPMWIAANAINPDSLFYDNVRYQLGHCGEVQRVFTQSGAGLGRELHIQEPWAKSALFSQRIVFSSRVPGIERNIMARSSLPRLLCR
jgi:hypothetical protein